MLFFVYFIFPIINLLVPLIFLDFFKKTRDFLLIFSATSFFICIIIINYFQSEVFFLKAKFHFLYISNLDFILEPFSLIFITLISFLWICSLLYTIGYCKINAIKNTGILLFFLNLSVVCSMLLAIASNLFTMFIFYELLTLCTIPLIAHHSSKKVWNVIEHYLKSLLIPSIIFLLPAILMIYIKNGDVLFCNGGIILNNFSKLQTVFLLLMFIFGITKVPLFPIHSWLIKAMVAQYPVSALLHGVLVVKSGIFCLYKILIYIFSLKYLSNIFLNNYFLISFISITILYSSIKALKTSNIKEILAYSTINQLALSLITALILTPQSMKAAIVHLFSHAFGKMSLFHALGNIYSVKRTYLVSDLKGIGFEMPESSFIICIAILSLLGIPPFAGFVSKFLILYTALKEGSFLVLIILLISTLLSVVYFSRFLIIFIIPKNSNFPFRPIEHKIPSCMSYSLFLSFCCIVFFIYIVLNLNYEFYL